MNEDSRDRPGEDDPKRWAARFESMDDPERIQWLGALPDLAGDAASCEQRLAVAARSVGFRPFDAGVNPTQWAAAVSGVYRAMPADSPCRYWLLLMLNRENSQDELTSLAELLASDPPEQADAAAAVVARLLQRPPENPGVLFPRLLDGVAHISAAAPILDLANYYHRCGRLPEHPAAARREQLAKLLNGLVVRMQSLENADTTKPQAEVAQTIDDTVALAISLCDSLGAVGGAEDVDALRSAMQLTHRRIRVVAAAALARLGIDEGVDVLLTMTAEPVARLQAIEFADELGIGERVEPSHRSPLALAESKLAFWLAQPTQFGVPPTRMAKVAERELYWPGFDDPQTMFLLRYEYQFGDARFVNIALSGAQVRACGADLTELSDDDRFALYAGLDIDHEDVYDIPSSQWEPVHQQEADRLAVRIRAAGYDQFEPAHLCFFLNEVGLAGAATQGGETFVVYADEQEILARPVGNLQRPFTAAEITALHHGYCALKTFNA